MAKVVLAEPLLPARSLPVAVTVAVQLVLPAGTVYVAE